MAADKTYPSQLEKVKEITDKLEAGIKELMESTSYKTFLNTMAKFHAYSLNNTILIAMQKPDATLVQSGSSNSNINVSLQSASGIIDFCINNNIAMRGHTFVWHSQTPEAFFHEGYDTQKPLVTREVMLGRLEIF